MKPGFKALVVDDDDFSRRTAARLLKVLGAAEVDEACDGEQALQAAAANIGRLDLIICDLRMGELDGIETLQGLAARNDSAVFVIASGVEPRLLRAAADIATRSGLKAFCAVSKPLTLAKVREAVESVEHLRRNSRAEPSRENDALGIVASDIQRGLARGELVAFFQPKVRMSNRQVEGAEALIRWQHPEHGLLAPGAFLHIAQAAGMDNDIFDFMLAASVARCAEWRRAGHDWTVNVNLSVPILTSCHLPRWLERFVAHQGVAPADITFEVTEDGWLQNHTTAREVLTRLRLRGFGLAIDDFGTRYSSMQQLLDAPFNEMKIDGSFVRAAPDDDECAVALASSIGLAHRLGLSVVGEGVETHQQWDVLANAGCDLVQGYLVARPIPGDDFVDWAADWRRMCYPEPAVS